VGSLLVIPGIPLDLMGGSEKEEMRKKPLPGVTSGRKEVGFFVSYICVLSK